jgi:rifampicin phosphotransferase
VRDRWITDWTPSPRWPHYTRANAGEVLPTPASPLGWTFSWENGMILGWRDGYIRGGNYRLEEFDTKRPEAIGSFGGYFYINLSNVRMQGVRNPAVTVDQLDLAFFGADPRIPPYNPHPDDEKPEYLDDIARHTAWVMTATEWPEIDDAKLRAAEMRDLRPNLSLLTPEELLARARATQPALIKLFEHHALSSSSSGLPPGILFAVGEAIGDPSIPMRLLASLGDVDSAGPAMALWQASRLVNASPGLTALFDAGLRDDSIIGKIEALADDDEIAGEFLMQAGSFLHEFGSRGPNEWEMYSESWETDRLMALRALDLIRHQTDDQSPTLRAAAGAADREMLLGEVRAKIAAMGDAGAELGGMFEAAISASRFMQWRERTKTTLVKVIHESRMVFRELGRRFHEQGLLDDPKQIFMLLDSELEDYIVNPGAMQKELASRAVEWAELWELEPPFFIYDGVVPPLSEWAKKGASTLPKAVTGDVLQGVPGCPGIARGRARVILDPTDPIGLDAGDILIAPLTDPAWTPLFLPAAAVVVNVGGQISHAVIVSRELGLPCAISVPNATDVIPDGAMIEVNGTTGTVTLL